MSSIAQISGLGYAGLTRTADDSADDLAILAIRNAVSDAGLELREVDGLLISRSGASTEPGLGLYLRSGLPALTLLQVIDCEGTSAIQMIHTASLAVAAGVARQVVCVFCDTPLKPGTSGRTAFSKAKGVTGIEGLRYSSGAYGGAANYALSASRYLHEYDIDERKLGAVAISNRAWAVRNPLALLRKPLTIEEYLASRFIVKPLRLFDCAMPVNGAIALVVTSANHVAKGETPPVYIHGVAQAHGALGNSFNTWKRAATLQASRSVFEMAHIGPADVDVCEFYDAFSVMTLLALEDYGFCARGEAGGLAEQGVLAPGGRLPCNTGGGHLSGFYLQGMTPVAEAIWQARGTAGERQCSRHDMVLVTNDGGWYDHHACLLLSPHKRLE